MGATDSAPAVGMIAGMARSYNEAGLGMGVARRAAILILAFDADCWPE